MSYQVQRKAESVIMSEKVREVFLEVIFKLIDEESVEACQIGKSRQRKKWKGRSLEMTECVPSLFVCLFVPAFFHKEFKMI